MLSTLEIAGRFRIAGAGAWLLFLAGTVLATAGPALLSWHVVETRALRLKRFF